MRGNLRVSIIVLNYDGLRFLDKCLSSLRKLNFPKDQYEIMLVDNGSVDGSIEFLEEKYNDVILIKNKKNLGVCIANNIGIRKSEAEYVLLLNNDLHLHKDFLKNLVAVMDKHPKAGCCGGDEYYYDDNIVNPKGDVRKTSWIGAGATIYRRKALDQSGFLDESFFYYCEDVDLAWRIKLAGWDIYQDETAVFYHEGKGRKVKLSDRTLLYSWRNRLYLLIKFASFAQIRKSLGLYFSLLGSRKKKKEVSHDSKDTTEKRKKNKEKSEAPPQENRSLFTRVMQKLFFLTKLSVSFLFYLPDMIVKRHKIQKKITDHKEVDSWIDYVDKDLRK
jgi:GT2 family glycosyltransferase